MRCRVLAQPPNCRFSGSHRAGCRLPRLPRRRQIGLRNHDVRTRRRRRHIRRLLRKPGVDRHQRVDPTRRLHRQLRLTFAHCGLSRLALRQSCLGIGQRRRAERRMTLRHLGAFGFARGPLAGADGGWVRRDRDASNAGDFKRQRCVGPQRGGRSERATIYVDPPCRTRQQFNCHLRHDGCKCTIERSKSTDCIAQAFHTRFSDRRPSRYDGRRPCLLRRCLARGRDRRRQLVAGLGCLCGASCLLRGRKCSFERRHLTGRAQKLRLSALKTGRGSGLLAAQPGRGAG